jgi:hypothetical protein
MGRTWGWRMVCEGWAGDEDENPRLGFELREHELTLQPLHLYGGSPVRFLSTLMVVSHLLASWRIHLVQRARLRP